MNTVSPSVCCKVRISSSKSPAEMGSRPEVGSSRKTISGSSAKARASATRLVMPPESSAGNLFASSRERPTISSLASAISSISLGDRSRFSRIGNCTFSRTVSEENSAPCWNRMPQRRSSARRSASFAFSRSTPSTSIEPWRLGKSPMTVRKRTDLPLPEAPTTPRISPPLTSSVRWSSTIWSPKPTTRSRTLITGSCGIGVTFRSRQRKWRTGRRER